MKYAIVVLALFTCVLHAVVGAFDTLYASLPEDQPLAVRGTLEAVWHLLSAFLLMSAFLFWNGGASARLTGVVWITGAAIFVAVAVARGGAAGLMELPQWTLLGLTGALSIWAERKS